MVVYFTVENFVDLNVLGGESVVCFDPAVLVWFLGLFQERQLLAGFLIHFNVKYVFDHFEIVTVTTYGI